MPTRITTALSLPLLLVAACVDPADASVDTDADADADSDTGPDPIDAPLSDVADVDPTLPAALARAGVAPFTPQEALIDPPQPHPTPGPLPPRPSEGEYIPVRGLTGAGWMPYQIVGDNVMIGDDVILGHVEKVLGLALDADSAPRSLTESNLGRRWPGKVVYWDYDEEVGIPNSLVIDDTLARLEAALPLDFVFNPGAADRIYFELWDQTFGLSEGIGMVGGAQKIKLPQSPNVRTIAHEVLHALGHFHEQQRSDRNDYVDYHVECAATPGNFTAAVGELHLGPYDLASLMHYGGNSQCIKDENNQCICPPLTYKGTDDPVSSPTSGCNQAADPICFLSDLDIGASWTMYGDFTDDTVTYGDYLGWALATGDFDGDGLDDLASSAVLAESWRGKVMTFKGSYGVKDGQWAAIDPGVVPWRPLRRSPFAAPVANDLFGMALVAADFDDDGFDDLAVGAPGVNGHGAVYLYRGSRTGLVADRELLPTTDGGNLPFAGADFGAALAAADINNDGVPELLVGAPGDRPSAGTNDCGGIYTYRLGGASDLVARWNPGGSQCQPGTEAGASLAGTSRNGSHGKLIVVGGPGADSARGRAWVLGYANTPALSTYAHLTQSAADACSGGFLDPNAREAGDRFGAAVAAGARGTSPIIAIGSPGEDSSNGRVDVFRYSTSCWLLEDTLSEAPLGANEAGDLFGAALAIGDLTGDGVRDLMVGAPGEAVGTVTAGWMYTFKGTGGGFTPHSGFGQSTGDWTNGNGERFGQSIALAEVDGNVPDLIVGAPGNHVGNASYAGSFFLWEGRGDDQPAPWRALSVDSKSPYAP